jgi:hypothetical protein
MAAIALVGITAYVFTDGGMHPPGIHGFDLEDKDDPDSISKDVLSGLVLEANGVGLAFRLTGGDDHGDSLTSYDYVAEVADIDSLRSFVAYANDNPDDPSEDATPNMGIITGPEEHGFIPAGLSWSLDGMQWNMGGVTRYASVDLAAWPITLEAARYLVPDLVEEEPSNG